MSRMFFKSFPLGRFLRQEQRHLVGPFLGASCGVLMAAGALLSLGLVFSQFVQGLSARSLSYDTLFPFALIGMMVSLGSYIRLYFAGRLVQRGWERFLPSLLRDALYHQMPRDVSLGVRLEKAEQALGQMLGASLFTALRSFLQGVGSFVMLVIYAPQWLIGLFGFLVFLSLPVALYRRALKPLIHQLNQRETTQQRGVHEIERYLGTLKAFRAESFYMAQAIVRAAGINTALQRKNHLRALFIAAIIGFVCLFVCGLLWVSLQALSIGDLTPDRLMLCCFFAVLLAGSLNNGAESFSTVMQGQAQLTGILNHLSPQAIQGKEDAISSNVMPLQGERKRQQISFEHLTFSYPGQRPLFEDMNLSLQRGQSVSFVAPSGWGKTTLAHLLLGLKKPTAGHIKMGRQVMMQPLWEALRVGYVPQSLDLFTQTVGQQITCGRSFDEKEMLRCLQQAGADHFIKSHDMDREMDGTDFAPFSRGQAQRIALARALYQDPEVLILDEPTSHLDQRVAEQVMARVLAAGRDRFTIVITHDLKLAQMTDHTYDLLQGDSVGGAELVAG